MFIFILSVVSIFVLSMSSVACKCSDREAEIDLLLAICEPATEGQQKAMVPSAILDPASGKCSQDGLSDLCTNRESVGGSLIGTIVGDSFEPSPFWYVQYIPTNMRRMQL